MTERLLWGGTKWVVGRLVDMGVSCSCIRDTDMIETWLVTVADRDAATLRAVLDEPQGKVELQRP